jgi:hypothetical protein
MPDFHHDADPDRLKHIFKTTDIRRLPMTGIVAGYHTLPFTLVGPNDPTGSLCDAIGQIIPRAGVFTQGTGSSSNQTFDLSLGGLVEVDQ